uniref:Uncharacterized protein n=1 Tax=Sphaerodactylus townsendi TaxID=933632 RepID=A0ACB8F6V5_9SAUR
MPRPFDTVPHVVVTPNHKIICVSVPKTIGNTCFPVVLGNPWERVVRPPQKVVTHRLRTAGLGTLTTSSPGNYCVVKPEFLKIRDTLYPKPTEVSNYFVANTLIRPQNKEGGGETTHHYKSTITPRLPVTHFGSRGQQILYFSLSFGWFSRSQYPPQLTTYRRRICALKMYSSYPMNSPRGENTDGRRQREHLMQVGTSDWVRGLGAGSTMLPPLNN